MFSILYTNIFTSEKSVLLVLAILKIDKLVL